MGLRIQTNMPSVNAQTALHRNNGQVEKAMERLATGFRVNKSSDDVAGLAISEQTRSTLRGVMQAEKNAQNGISFIQVAEGGLKEASNIVIRLRELATQAASDTVGTAERGFLDLEVQQLKSELDRISKTTEYSGTRLLDGSGETLDFHIGARGTPENRISFDASKADSSVSSLGLDSISVAEKGDAQSALENMDDSITKINAMRANFGAFQSRMDTTIKNLKTSGVNLTAAISRIRDADFAAESANLAKATVLQNAGTMVLAQANSSAGAALKLL